MSKREGTGDEQPPHRSERAACVPWRDGVSLRYASRRNILPHSTDMTYYDRVATTHVDGSPVFRTKEDEASEEHVARILAQAWGCDVLSFGALSAVDWYCVKAGRVAGVLELKTRSHELGRYPTVFLNVRKWLALTLAATGLGVPAIFVVRFRDGIRWIRVADIDATQVRMGGLRHQVKSRNDQEPVIEVPIVHMQGAGLTAQESA